MKKFNPSLANVLKTELRLRVEALIAKSKDQTDNYREIFSTSREIRFKIYFAKCRAFEIVNDRDSRVLEFFERVDSYLD